MFGGNPSNNRQEARDQTRRIAEIELESPIISPDIESGTLSKLSPRNRPGHAEKTASFAFASKLESCPESRDSPGISARQQVTSRKKGVLAKHLATQEWILRTAHRN
jgi:hypothetical protein